MSNVGVAVRVRPLTGREKSQGAEIVVRVDHARRNVLLVTNPKKNLPLSCKNRKREVVRSEDQKQTPLRQFSFDFCYNLASQEQIHEDVGIKVLEAAFEGYNACVLAYGQSGSGKTFTMMGQKGDLGLIPRICKDLFNRLQEKAGDNQLTYRAEVSFFEIYNEKVSDLLRASAGGSVTYSHQRSKPNLRIREHPKLGPCVQDLSKHVVTDFGSVRLLIERGIQHRRVAATRMHDRSSRSHAVFTINFTRSTSSEDLLSEVVSRVHLVDLAGSEKATIGMNKMRLKEGANINKSLVALGSVIFALAEKCLSANGPLEEQTTTTDPLRRSGRSAQLVSPVFVPYRDSVLTWLLKESLGGNSKTILVATVSPASTAYNETINTLRYAQRAKCIVNKPVVNEDPNVKLIRQLKAEVTKLRHLLFDTYHDKQVKWTTCGQLNGDVVAHRSLLSSHNVAGGPAHLFPESDENEPHFSRSLKSIGQGRSIWALDVSEDIRITSLVFDCLHNAWPYPFRYWPPAKSKSSNDGGADVQNEITMDSWPAKQNPLNQSHNIGRLSLQRQPSVSSDPVSNEEDVVAYHHQQTPIKVKGRSNWSSVKWRNVSCRAMPSSVVGSKSCEHEASVVVEIDIQGCQIHPQTVLYHQLGFSLNSSNSSRTDTDYDCCEEDKDDVTDDSPEERLVRGFNHRSEMNAMKSCRNRPKIRGRYFSGGCAKNSRENYATSGRNSSSSSSSSDRRQKQRRIKKRRRKLSSVKRLSLDSRGSHLACSPPPLCKPLETSSFLLKEQETTCNCGLEPPEMRQNDASAMSTGDHLSLTSDSLEDGELDATADRSVIKTSAADTDCPPPPPSRGRCQRNRLHSWDSLTMVYMGPEWGSTETNIDHDDHHSPTSSIEEDSGRRRATRSCNETTAAAIISRPSDQSSTNALNGGPSEATICSAIDRQANNHLVGSDGDKFLAPEAALPISDDREADVETSIKHSSNVSVDGCTLPSVVRTICCKCCDHVDAAIASVDDRGRPPPPPSSCSSVKRTSETSCQTSTVFNDTTSQTEPVRFAAGTQTNPLRMDVGTQTDEANLSIGANATAFASAEFLHEPTKHIAEQTTSVDMAVSSQVIGTSESGIGQRCSACSHAATTIGISMKPIDTSKSVQQLEWPVAMAHRHVTQDHECHSSFCEEKEGEEEDDVNASESSRTIKRRRSRTCKQCSFFRRQLFRQLEQRDNGGQDCTATTSMSTSTPLNAAVLKNPCHGRDRNIDDDQQLRHSDYDSDSEDDYRSLPSNQMASMRCKNNNKSALFPCHEHFQQRRRKLSMSEIDSCGREPADGDSMSAKPEAGVSLPRRHLLQSAPSSFVGQRRRRPDVAECAAPISSAASLDELPKTNCDQLTVEVQALLRECRAVRRKAWFQISEAVVDAAPARI